MAEYLLWMSLRRLRVETIRLEERTAELIEALRGGINDER